MASVAAVFLCVAGMGKTQSMDDDTDIDIVVLIREHLQVASRTMRMHEDGYVAVQTRHRAQHRSSSVVAA